MSSYFITISSQKKYNNILQPAMTVKFSKDILKIYMHIIYVQLLF